MKAGILFFNPHPLNNTTERQMSNLQWVKASEKLPDEPDSPWNHIRLNGRKVNGNFYDLPFGKAFRVFHHDGDYDIPENEFGRLEWLSESPAPTVETGGEELKRFTTFVNWMYDAGWRPDDGSEANPNKFLMWYQRGSRDESEHLWKLYDDWIWSQRQAPAPPSVAIEQEKKATGFKPSTADKDICENCGDLFFHCNCGEPSAPTSTGRSLTGHESEVLQQTLLRTAKKERKADREEGEVPEEIMKWINDYMVGHRSSGVTRSMIAMYHHLQKVIEGYIQSGRNIVAQNESLCEERDRAAASWNRLVEENEGLRAKVKELQEWHDSHL
jgi:hypothetical protein